MRNDTRPAGPDRGKREEITAGAAGAIGAVAVLVMILINAPPTAITVVIGAAAIAAVLAVSIMVTGYVERGVAGICAPCWVRPATRRMTAMTPSKNGRHAAVSTGRSRLSFALWGDNVNGADKWPYPR